MSVLNLTGYSFSGKSYLFDVLSSFGNFTEFNSEFEFDLFRQNDGIINLYRALVDGNVVEYNNIHKNLSCFIRMISSSSSVYQKLFCPGQNINNKFPRLRGAYEQLFSDISSINNYGYWPYYNQSPIFNLLKKLKLVSSESEYFYCTISNESLVEVFKDFTSNLFFGSDFLVSNLLDSNTAMYSKKFSVPTIVVDRDPRDIYLSAYFYNGSLSNVVIGNSVDDFISRFLHQRKNKYDGVLYVKFEDLILDFETQLSLIESYSKYNFSLDNIVEPSKNIHMWRNIHDKNLLSDIYKIENKLEHYL